MVVEEDVLRNSALYLHPVVGPSQSVFAMLLRSTLSSQTYVAFRLVDEVSSITNRSLNRHSRIQLKRDDVQDRPSRCELAKLGGRHAGRASLMPNIVNNEQTNCE